MAAPSASKKARKEDFKWTVAHVRHAGVLAAETVYDSLQASPKPSTLVKTIALRDRILLDLAEGNSAHLGVPLRALAALDMDHHTLLATGVHLLLQDSDLWSMTSNPSDRRFATVLRQKWRTSLPRANVEVHSDFAKLPKLAVFNVSTFLADVRCLAVFLGRVDDLPVAKNRNPGLLRIPNSSYLTEKTIERITLAILRSSKR